MYASRVTQFPTHKERSALSLTTPSKMSDKLNCTMPPFSVQYYPTPPHGHACISNPPLSGACTPTNKQAWQAKLCCTAPHNKAATETIVHHTVMGLARWQRGQAWLCCNSCPLTSPNMCWVSVSPAHVSSPCYSSSKSIVRATFSRRVVVHLNGTLEPLAASGAAQHGHGMNRARVFFLFLSLTCWHRLCPSSPSAENKPQHRQAALTPRLGSKH